MKISLLIVTISLLLSSCSKEDILPVENAATFLNVSYGSDFLQKMDVYLPPNRSASTTKVIVLIHGGAWSAGDKSASDPFVDTLSRRLPSYAIFNINYRLANGVSNLFPAQENDVKSAIEYIYAHRMDYKISDKIVLAGESAGGHLAMLHAYKYNTPVKVKAVISFFGPSDLVDMYNNPVNGNPLIPYGLIQVTGQTPSQNPAIYYSSSPVNFISNSAGVPTILFHGSNDPLVAPSQSENVYQALLMNGFPSSYTLYPGKGHGDDWDSATFNDAFSKITTFLNTHVP